MKNNFFVSSCAFSGDTISDIINVAEFNNISVEFSSGIPFEENLLEKMYRAKINKMIHNYFPAPSVPFVLNLASDNKSIREQSIKHCFNGIDISKKIYAPFFSIHAGFCIDPKPLELGNKISIKSKIERNVHFDIFIDSLKILVDYASVREVKLLIENNVIAKFNLKSQISNPFLCTESIEIIKVFDLIQSNYLGFLCDTGHLKVSSNTLGLNLNEEFGELLTLVNCVHHSDNNGLIDSNSLLNENYWFLPHFEKLKDIFHVIEVKNINVGQIFDQLSLLEKYGS